MSEEKFDIAGLNLKEWSFIILMISLIIVVASFAVAFIIAISNSPDAITISGTIDLGQITGIIFGIAMVATVLVGQKLTSNAVTTAVAETDKVWLAEK